MMMLISAVTTSVIINVTTILIATDTSWLSDSSAAATYVRNYISYVDITHKL